MEYLLTVRTAGVVGTPVRTISVVGRDSSELSSSDDVDPSTAGSVTVSTKQ